MVRPEAVIGAFFLSALAFYLVGLDDGSPVYVESGWVLLGLALAWWSSGWLMRRWGAPLFGKAWLWGSGVFLAAYLGLGLMLVFAAGS